MEFEQISRIEFHKRRLLLANTEILRNQDVLSKMREQADYTTYLLVLDEVQKYVNIARESAAVLKEMTR